PITLGSSVSDPGTADTHTLAWTVTKNSVAYASGSGANFSFTPDDNGTYVVTLTVTDDDGGTASDTKTITVTNVSPTVAITGAPTSSPEGTPITLGSSLTDPGTADTHTLAWSVTRHGQAYASGTGTSFNFTPNDNGTYVITLTATDDDGDTASDSAVVTVAGTTAAVTVSVSGPADGVRGQVRTFSLSAWSSDAASQAAGFEYRIQWGDGSPTQLVARTPGNATGLSVHHIFRTQGTYQVRVVAVDQNGTASEAATHQITIHTMALQPDPLHPGRVALVIGGTPGNDAIRIYRRPGAGDIGVRINREAERRFVPNGASQPSISRIIVYAQAGNDHVDIQRDVSQPAWFFGGDGNDYLHARSGNNVLVGGAGNDQLLGGMGRDLLIGGLGSDLLHGGSGQDILIDGPTIFDDWEVALNAILAEWTSARPLERRIQNLRGQGGAVSGANGNFFLTDDTVLADGVLDRLLGGADLDWYFIAGNPSSPFVERP
ncbi:MAG: PKD domain-containing protein, partial [Gemmatales bacterium]|nr:PKD domain-containing protein [Gemmatales bacterium]